ncbi:MAG: YlxR family protein [Clostridiales bacterium]|nr:YlxR family protein [Clostridiales bacterium]
MGKNKSVPLRMCVACRQMKPKNEMTRVVKSADGEIFADPTGKAPGRGAYVCGDEACLKKLKLKKLFNKAFSTDVPQAVYCGVEGEKVDEK